MTEFRKGRHVVHNLHAHLVLTTKYRREAITTARVRDCLEATMRSVCSDFGASLQAFEADGDHVHLLLAWPPQVALSRLVGSLKGVSARILRQKSYPEVATKLWGDHFWSPSYCLVSCGGAPLETIKAYVESQADPNRSKTGAMRRAAARKRKKDMMAKEEDALTSP